jgi:membrane peptidoglycan carboxypeptidase
VPVTGWVYFARRKAAGENSGLNRSFSPGGAVGSSLPSLCRAAAGRSWAAVPFCLQRGAAGQRRPCAVFGYIWLTLNENGLLKIPDREPGMMVLAADGSVLAEQGAFNGDEARLSELPSYVPNAVIAIEDRRFRSHFGVDPIGLVRAISSTTSPAASCRVVRRITQQLAKNLFLSHDRTMQRKLQEVVLAVWLETQFTKDEILQLYLNRVYYGAGATGIEKAARTYYQKSASELTLMEAATLAGVLKSPSNTNPSANPKPPQRAEGSSSPRWRMLVSSQSSRLLKSPTSRQEVRRPIMFPPSSSSSTG